MYLRPGAASRRRATSFLAQHDRRLARLAYGRQRTNEVGPLEHNGEKEPQRGDGGVDAPCADQLLRHMQLKTAKVLARGCVRRPAEEGREDPDVPDVTRTLAERSAPPGVRPARDTMVALDGAAVGRLAAFTAV